MYQRNNQTQFVINLPQSSIASHIIGKGGSQINKLKETTGCAIYVKNDIHVEIKGTRENVEKAKFLIQLIINNAMAVYEHPNAVCNVFKVGNEAKMHFKECGKSVNGNNRVYSLVMDSSSQESSEDELVNQMASLNLNKSIIDESTVSQTFAYSDIIEKKLVDEGVERVSKSYLDMSKDTSLKHKMMIKISLGKKTFYPAQRQVSELNTSKIYSFNEFSNLKIGYGKDLKCTWKPDLDEKLVCELRNHLLENNWKLSDESEGVSCHYVKVVNGIVGRDNAKGGKRLDFKVVRNGTKCELKKIRRQQNKLMFLDICEVESKNSSTNCPDMRIRFQTEQHELNPLADSDLNEFVSYLEFEKGGLSDRNVPNSLMQKFSKDILRYKKKEIYVLENMKISINSVSAEGRNWFEVQLSPISPFSSASDKEEMIIFTSKMIKSMNDILSNCK